MDAIRRLREHVAESPDSSEEHEIRSSSPGASSSTSKTDDQDHEVWYRHLPRGKGKGKAIKNPYDFFHVSINGEYEATSGSYEPDALGVVFWPFTSPEDAEISQGEWDDMEGVIAVASSCKLLVVRVSDQGYEELWSFEMPGEGMNHVEWSYDYRTLRPLIAIGGLSRVIRILDYRSRQVIKILRGHGGEIISLKFHPNKPHILASASGDKTVRIWNIHGAELERPTTPSGIVNLSENFPQGDADEGTVAVGILAGEQFGHRAEVSALAFHPCHDAIASGGYDRQVKIWPLPALPSAMEATSERTQTPTKPGHRPVIIHEPLFSTDTIHGGPVDCLEWDVVISKALTETIAWQWTAYPLYFDKDEIAPRTTIPPIYHSRESLSYQICVDFSQTSDFTYWRFGLHLPFVPEQDEIDFSGVDPDVFVTDALIAYPVKSLRTHKLFGKGFEFPPRIRMINPAIWRSLLDRRPRKQYTRPKTPDDFGDIPLDLPDELGDEALPIMIDVDVDQVVKNDAEEATVNESEDDESDDTDESEDPDSDPSLYGTPVPINPHESLPDVEDSLVLGPEGSAPVPNPHDRDYDQPKPARDDIPKRSPTLDPRQVDNYTRFDYRYRSRLGKPQPWHLVVPAKIWEKTINLSNHTAARKKELRTNITPFRGVAISPRGAKWVVAVGHAEMIAVWRLPEPPQ